MSPVASQIKDYLHEHPYSARATRIRSNTVAQLMQALGYTYIFVPSGYYLTAESPLADMTIRSDLPIQSALAGILIEYSIFGYFLRSERRLTHNAVITGMFESARGTRKWYEHITRSIAAIETIPEIDGPTFTFAHIISPHPPYVFNPDGSFREESTMSEMRHTDNYNWWSESTLFINQLTHLNRLLEGMIHQLLTKSSTAPIIILQGDHGTLGLAGKYLNTDNPSDDLIKERMSILLALYVPDVINVRLYDSMTPANLFRVILSEYSGLQYPLLPDENFWSLSGTMKNVTAIVRGGQ